ncbi:MAG: hypothetical protein P4M11_14330 [Candidatus Pacebacteria bacterium]|nr:hypothetical protein [Candidatus Paceibacterota bacterium]
MVVISSVVVAILFLNMLAGFCLCCHPERDEVLKESVMRSLLVPKR